ncbi:MAG: ECF-type sigma factor [Gemmatimonadota bacterium]
MASHRSPIDIGEPDTLFPIVYDELKRLARRQLRNVDANATLSTTELVHETFLKLAGDGEAEWDSRAHFFGSASHAMRQVLVDFARRRRAAKRGGSWRSVSLSAADASLEIQLDEILALDAALDQLDSVDPRLRQVVELRFFGGAPLDDVARLLGVSPRTVERDWLKARLFLLHQLRPGEETGGGSSQAD